MDVAMQVPRELLDEKLLALELVLPSLLADADPGLHRAEFAKLSEELLQQCMPDDRNYALARLGKIRLATGPAAE